ncbi:MAG: hypothetical protein V1874_16665 [Spirochaetota bacterium]
MKRIILAIILFAIPAFAKDAPDFNALKKSWGSLNSLTITKSAGEKYAVSVRKGAVRTSRDLYMIVPDKPEIMLWLFHGYKPEGDPYKQSPEILIKNMGLKELSSWHNALVVIVDSGTSLYVYNPDNGLSELRIYLGIYDKLVKLHGALPVILSGISSGAEGAVKFAPLISKLKSLICISGTYDYSTLAADSGEYKIHLKEYASPAGWEIEQPVTIFPAIKCRIILLSEELSIYRQQAALASRIKTSNKTEFMKDIGKGKSHNWDFWASAEVKKILQRELQAAGDY